MNHEHILFLGLAAFALFFFYQWAAARKYHRQVVGKKAEEYEDYAAKAAEWNEEAKGKRVYQCQDCDFKWFWPKEFPHDVQCGHCGGTHLYVYD